MNSVVQENLIKNLESQKELVLKYKNEGKIMIQYPFVISILVMTFRRESGLYIFSKEQILKRFLIGLLYSALSFGLGWWGFPWGLIYTPIAVLSCLIGGNEVGGEILKNIDKRIMEIRKTIPAQESIIS